MPRADGPASSETRGGKSETLYGGTTPKKRSTTRVSKSTQYEGGTRDGKKGGGTDFNASSFLLTDVSCDRTFPSHEIQKHPPVISRQFSWAGILNRPLARSTHLATCFSVRGASSHR